MLSTNALSEGHSFCAVHLARSNELGPFRFLKASFFYDTDGIASLLGECHYLIALAAGRKRLFTSATSVISH